MRAVGLARPFANKKPGQRLKGSVFKAIRAEEYVLPTMERRQHALQIRLTT